MLLMAILQVVYLYLQPRSSYLRYNQAKPVASAIRAKGIVTDFTIIASSVVEGPIQSSVSHAINALSMTERFPKALLRAGSRLAGAFRTFNKALEAVDVADIRASSLGVLGAECA